jgi:hypothetical protein
MPTPVGPVAPDPDDPDLWDWDDDRGPRRHLMRLVLVGFMVLALVLLVVISVL